MKKQSNRSGSFFRCQSRSLLKGRGQDRSTYDNRGQTDFIHHPPVEDASLEVSIDATVTQELFKKRQSGRNLFLRFAIYLLLLRSFTLMFLSLVQAHAF